MTFFDKIRKLRNRWFPERPDVKKVSAKLAAFYRGNQQYHEMTKSVENKLEHPQVKLLSCLIREGCKYADVGCGGGVVARMVGETGFVYGFDVSPIAISNAKAICSGKSADFTCCSVDSLPLNDNSVSGSYSFEVLEHVWDPVAVVREMVRVTEPGGFILISTPNYFSLDLHLRKKTGARLADFILAGLRFISDFVIRRPYCNICPDLEGEIYSDCDMITSLIPGNFARVLDNMGCSVDFWDTTYMCSHRDGSKTTLNYQKNTARPFIRHFGDHILLLAHKKNSAELL